MEKIEIDKIREIQLGILETVDCFCKKNKITCFLGYGTLLGAVRHKGYIPWDDDIDIMMPRKDYDKFIQKFSSLDYDVKSHYKDENYPFPYAKVSYEKSRLIENTDLQYKMGINIDVFPLDTFKSNHYSFNRTYKQIKFYQMMLTIKKVSINSNRKYYKNAILKIGKFILRPIKYKCLIKKIDELAKSDANVMEPDLMGCIVESYERKDIMNLNVFTSIAKLQFEQKWYDVPSKYDEYLTNIYGDYMQLPPLEEQKTHHDFEAFY